MAVSDDGAIRITLRDVYEKVESTERNVAMLVLGAADVKSLGVDHETRLRSLERRVWAIPSAAVLLAAASLIVALLSLHAGRTPSPSTSVGSPPVTAPAQTPVRAPKAAPVSVSPRAPQTHETAVQAPETPVSPKPPATTSPTVPPAPVPPAPAPVVTLVDRLSSLAPVVEKALPKL